MGISLKDLIKNEKTVIVPIGEENIEVVFRPGEFTDTFFATLNDEETDIEGMNYAIKTLITRWNIEGDNGEELPVNEKTLSLIPIPIKAAIVKVVTENMSTTGDEKKPIGGSFSPKVQKVK